MKGREIVKARAQTLRRARLSYAREEVFLLPSYKGGLFHEYGHG